MPRFITDIPEIRPEDILPPEKLPVPGTPEWAQRYAYNARLFAREQFPWGVAGTDLEHETGLERWQDELLYNIDYYLLKGGDESGQSKVHVSVASGHGIGKGAVCSMLTLNKMSCFYNLAGVVTANTINQIRSITHKEVAKWLSRFRHRDMFVMDNEKLVHAKHNRTWRVDFKSWDRDKAEGFAGLHGPFVLVIFDEASNIPPIIWETVSGAFSDGSGIHLVLGNPTRGSGPFYNCFTEKNTKWISRQVSSLECRRTDKEYFKQIIEEQGEDSDYVRVRVKGEFPLHAFRTVFGRDEVEAAAKAEPYFDENQPIIMGIDPARKGESKSAFVLRQGRAMLPEVFHRSIGDAMILSEKACEFAIRNNVDIMVIDAHGLGGPVADAIRMKMGNNKIRLMEFSGSHQPMDQKLYYNLRTESWCKAAEWIKTASIVDNEDLKSQLCSVEIFQDDKDRMRLEKKSDMHKRGVESPDLADALTMTLAYNFPVKNKPPPEEWGSREGKSWMSF